MQAFHNFINGLITNIHKESVFKDFSIQRINNDAHHRVKASYKHHRQGAGSSSYNNLIHSTTAELIEHSGLWTQNEILESMRGP